VVCWASAASDRQRDGGNLTSADGSGPGGGAAGGSLADSGGAGDGVRITWLGHATVLIEFDGVRLLTDPLLGNGLGPLRRVGPTPDPVRLGAMDAVLVSHAHPDHFDLDSLRRVGGQPLLLVPGGLGRAARRAGASVRELGAGDSLDLARPEAGVVRVTAVPARHWRWPLQPRARCLGYLVEGSIGIYFAGDTALFPAMSGLAGRVAVALLPVGRWGPHRGPDRLTPASAVEAMSRVGARAAIPIHWGTLHPPGFAPGRWGSPSADAGARFAQVARESASGLDIRVLQPGESTEFLPDAEQERRTPVDG
jgi:L-ascorbate metabolism protein UlaG (beta-lactamase superfamily)